ncbi:hypothetical protein [Staphylococcus lutrae]|uniref:Staphylococcal protein n=1 Tax=Staphylococcus lutrae TaxID=155085 RepID=A0AAC9RRD2_9STAP|nr:hypothetical protein [Staphylococcus lutrae]ARJ49884.1 hypothetical protein B5P37_00220 [Staphylococcus lutrae]PNZ37753.1 hypothetical protein CD134_05645 [Staphylococcus lutrae]
MSIGAIIFIITIVISIIQAVFDKSHKDRPQPKQPQKELPKSETFMEKVQKKLETFELEFPENEQKEQPTQQTKQRTPKKVMPTQTQTHPMRSESMPSGSKAKQQSHADLQQMLDYEMQEIDKLLDKERQKRMTHIQRRANDILQDRYLSKRTKEIKLKQLLANNSNTVVQQSDLTFSENEVVNGVIWSEILQRPNRW